MPVVGIIIQYNTRPVAFYIKTSAVYPIFHVLIFLSTFRSFNYLIVFWDLEINGHDSSTMKLTLVS